MLVRGVEASGFWESKHGLNPDSAILGIACNKEMWTCEKGFYFFLNLGVSIWKPLCKQGIYIWYDTSLSFGIFVSERYFRS